jgi:hypothetical protein
MHRCFAAIGLCLAASCASPKRPQAPVALQDLPVMKNAYPRAFFFRSSESLARNPKVAYDEWEKTFERLMGIEGKVLDEEIPGTSKRNIEFFTRFKQRHPDQLVMLHFNGNARDPRYQASEFFAGHWLYFNGTKIPGAVPAADGETEIRVADASLFRTSIGRYMDKSEDIGLCVLSADGKPNWAESEQVELVSTDVKRGVIRVRRGQFGSKPRAFEAGKAYAAAHVQEGPWGRQSNLMWYYNYSADCPRDAKGRTATDVLLDDIVKRFSAGGELEVFDALEFDVLRHQVQPHDEAGREVDSDNDGAGDKGWVNGVNRYGIGVVEFCRRLRERFPSGKLLLADGMAVRNQRAFGILNGIESEGFPELRDIEIKDWSGGMNRHFFWAANARPPVLNYINHKFIVSTPGQKEPELRPDIPFPIHRLAFAAAMFTDAALCYSYSPQREPGERIGIWDELKMGTGNKTGWLGKPLGPAMRMAQQQPDLLEGKGSQPAALAAGIIGGGVEAGADGAALRISGKTPGLAEMKFRLRGIPAKAPDLFVAVTMKGAPRDPYPPEMARLLFASLTSIPDARFMTWVNQKEFTSGFYFSGVKPGTTDLEFSVEGTQPIWLSKISVHAHADAVWREFEHGLVLANPSPHPYTFDLSRIAAGKVYRRLKGSSKQDTVVNNGTPAGAQVELPAKDAIFLVRE